MQPPVCHALSEGYLTAECSNSTHASREMDCQQHIKTAWSLGQAEKRTALCSFSLCMHHTPSPCSFPSEQAKALSSSWVCMHACVQEMQECMHAPKTIVVCSCPLDQALCSSSLCMHTLTVSAWHCRQTPSQDKTATDGSGGASFSLSAFGSIGSGRNACSTDGTEDRLHQDDHHPYGSDKAPFSTDAPPRDLLRLGDGKDDQEAGKQPEGDLWSSSPFAWQPLHQDSLAAFQ